MTEKLRPCNDCGHLEFTTTEGCECGCHAVFHDMVAVQHGDTEKAKQIFIDHEKKLEKVHPALRAILTKIAMRTINPEELTPEELYLVEMVDRLMNKE